MELDEAKMLYGKCQRDRQTALEAVAGARMIIESSSRIMEALRIRFPELAEAEAADAESVEMDTAAWDASMDAEVQRDAPRGAEAVLSILQVHEARDYSVTEMVTALKRNDWLPQSDNPANAVRSALERLKNTPRSGVNKVYRKDGSVAYRYDEPGEEPF